jgi:hypothetical protein
MLVTNTPAYFSCDLKKKVLKDGQLLLFIYLFFAKTLGKRENVRYFKILLLLSL